MSEPAQDPSIISVITKALPGFLGAVVAAVYIQRPATKTEGLIAILSGLFTSVFMTPFVVQLFAPGNPHAYAGLGYGIGLCTVILLPSLMRRAQEIVSQLTLADFLGLGKKKD